MLFYPKLKACLPDVSPTMGAIQEKAESILVDMTISPQQSSILDKKCTIWGRWEVHKKNVVYDRYSFILDICLQLKAWLRVLKSCPNFAQSWGVHILGVR